MHKIVLCVMYHPYLWLDSAFSFVVQQVSCSSSFHHFCVLDHSEVTSTCTLQVLEFTFI